MNLPHLFSIFTDFGRKQPYHQSKFKIGDKVQLIEDGQSMIVSSIVRTRKMNEPLIVCKWYESNTGNVSDFFLEKELEFDCDRAPIDLIK